jgi:hypothetical protein
MSGNGGYQSAPQGTACNENGGKVCDGFGKCIMTDCVTAMDCPGQDTECGKRTCDGGVCGYFYAPLGMPTMQQKPGDCQLNICDGFGGVTTKMDDSDAPAAVGQCFVAACQMGNPTQFPVPQGTACNENGGNICDGFGTCIKVECVTAMDCPGTGNECDVAICDGGHCGHAFVPAGTPTSQQTQGDCLLNICDGSGGATVKPDDSDTYPAPGECWGSICVEGATNFNPLPFGSSCRDGIGFCDGQGHCIS